jgi:hypothetical protein
MQLANKASFAKSYSKVSRRKMKTIRLIVMLLLFKKLPDGLKQWNETVRDTALQGKKAQVGS